jgi:hypothetical protein
MNFCNHPAQICVVDLIIVRAMFQNEPEHPPE